jgi:hypothetical protein
MFTQNKNSQNKLMFRPSHSNESFAVHNKKSKGHEHNTHLTDLGICCECCKNIDTECGVSLFLWSSDISGCDSITGAGVASLKHIPSLTRLHLGGCVRVGGKTVAKLVHHLPELRDLDISFLRLTSTVLIDIVQRAPRLCVLDVYNVQVNQHIVYFLSQQRD